MQKRQERFCGETNQNQTIKAPSARARFPALSVVEESRHRDGSIVQNVTTEKIEDPFSKIYRFVRFLLNRAAKFSLWDM